MIDGEKIFKALKLGKVTGLGCTLTSAECGYLIAHDDALTQYIILLENDQLMKQRIAELEARIAELEEANKYWSKRALMGECWIPISEKLPEKSGTYLVWYKHYLEMANFDWISTKWQICYTNWITDIDYWMPLPVPPIMYGKACIDQLTAHDATERQDDKSSNDTQKDTFVYGKERER